MQSIAHSRWSFHPDDAPISIERIAGGSVKVFGFLIPAARVAEIDTYAEELEPGFAVMYTASCLADRGLDAEQIEAVLRHLFGRNPRVSQREIASAAWGFSAKPWEPHEGLTARRQTSRAIRQLRSAAPGPFDLEVERLLEELNHLRGLHRA